MVVMGGLSDRDDAIVAARQSGLTYREIGERFGVSGSRAQSIVSKHQRKQKIQAKAEELWERVRAADELEKKWPINFLLEALALPFLPDRAIRQWHQETGASEFSLQGLIDYVLPENVERGPDEYPASPFTQQRGVGRKTYKALIKHLAGIDLGEQFNKEWVRRTKNQGLDI